MAEISLRAYVKELDDLIEHEQLDEAIAHCRHILQTYPKHLEVYRLLGKAYLEAKRYGDAADIFQRVLSAVPDDFVAHIGMAIVREDEGNLDAAIWHMERAFETNPSNPAIQQELRRLIGRRDGLEPHKVRLTRGALARMYAHGELYAQAIAELRSALQEDADRPDLQVLLAEMHWRLGQRSEAAEVCQKLLEALPFCREANRIMASALQSSGQSEEAVIYHRRLASLDPYAALVETAMDDPNRVDPNAVRIDKLAWVAGQPIPGAEGQPEWAASLGVDMRADVPRPSPKKPTWLESLASETAAAQQAEPPVPAMRTPEPPPAPAPAPAPIAAEPAEKEIPDWMRRAGWSEGSGQAVEAPVSFSDSELASLEAGTLPPAEGELAPADIPDWLKDIAPAEGIPAPEAEAAPAPEAPIATGEADWLAAGAKVSSDDEAPKLPPGWSGPRPGPQQPARAEEPQVQGPAIPPPSVPTWMEEAAPGATETIVTWLGDRSKEALGRAPSTSIPAPEIPETPEPVSAEEPDLFKESLPEGVPDWLSEEVSWGAAAEPGAAEAPKSSEPGRPAWLSGVAAAAAEGESLRPEQLPWTPPELAAEAEAPAQLGMYAEEPAEPSGPPAEVPDWIKAIAGADLGPETPEENAPAEAPPAEQPDWLRQSEPLAEEAASRPPLDWSQERETPAVEAEPVELPFIPAEEHAVEAPRESLAWLRELAEAEPPSPAAEAEPEAEAPGWLKGIGEERPARSVLGRASSPEWLRGIAEPEPEPAEQLSDEGTLDWMRGIAEGQPPAPAQVSAPTEPARAEPAAGPEMAWLNLGGGDQAPSPTSTGEWLRRLKAEGVPAERDLPTPPPPTPPTPPDSEDALDDEQVFQWLESLAARQTPEGAEPTTMPQADVPESAPAGGTPSIEPARLPPEEPSEGLEWLEQLASERGLETPVAVPPPQTAPPAPVTPPALAVPEPPPPATSTAAAAPAPEVPDWLRELVAESPTPTPQPPAAPPPTAPTPTTAETWPALPEWMLASSAEDTEPAIPLPPARDAVEPKEAEEVPSVESAPVEKVAPVEKTPTPAPAAPIEELAEGWVPPWESLELEPEPPAPAPPPAPVVRPTDETLYVPPRKPAPAEETVYRRPTPVPEPMPPARPPTAPLRPVVPPEPEEEIPDWLQTPIPYVPPRTRPTAPSPITAEATPPVVPTPAATPEPAPRPVEHPAAPPPVVPSYEPPPPVAPSYEAPAPVPPSYEAPPPVAPSYEAPAPVAPGYQSPPPVAPSYEAPAPVPPVMPAAAAPIEPPPAPTPAPPVVVPPPAAVVPPPSVVPAPVEAAIPSAVAPREERRVEPVPPPIPAAMPTVKPPTRAPRGRGGADPSTVLDAARKALATGDYHKAASSYATLIKRNFEVNSIAEELRLALDRNPRTPVLWQTLGDAYMKGDRLPDAIEAYRRGMESA